MLRFEPPGREVDPSGEPGLLARHQWRLPETAFPVSGVDESSADQGHFSVGPYIFQSHGPLIERRVSRNHQVDLGEPHDLEGFFQRFGIEDHAAFVVGGHIAARFSPPSVDAGPGTCLVCEGLGSGFLRGGRSQLSDVSRIKSALLDPANRPVAAPPLSRGCGYVFGRSAIHVKTIEHKTRVKRIHENLFISAPFNGRFFICGKRLMPFPLMTVLGSSRCNFELWNFGDVRSQADNSIPRAPSRHHPETPNAS